MTDNELVTSGDEDLDISREISVAVSDGKLQIVPNNFRQVLVIAKTLSMSDICVPPAFRGNRGACLQVTLDALRVGASPFALVNQAYVTKDKFGNERVAYQAQAIHAIVNGSKVLKRRLRQSYEGDGPDRRCVIIGEIVGEDEPFEYKSPPIRQIGVKNSPLWVSDQDQQLSYYSTRAWSRRHVPEVILGMFTPDDLGSDPVDITPAITENFFAPLSNGEDRESSSIQAIAPHTEAQMVDDPQTIDQVGEELRAVRSAPFGIMPRDANPLPRSGGSYTSTVAPTASSPTPRDTGEVKHRSRPSYKDYADRILTNLRSLYPNHTTIDEISRLLKVNARTTQGALDILKQANKVECDQYENVRLAEREAVVPSVSEKEEPVTGLTQQPRVVDDESPTQAMVDKTENEPWRPDDGEAFAEEAPKHDIEDHADGFAPLHEETLGSAEEGDGSPIPPREISENVKSWWRMAEQDNAFMLRIDDRYPISTYKEFLIDLAEGAPNTYRLERFATANAKNIDSVQGKLGLEAAQHVRDVIDRMRRELNPRR